MIKKDKIITVKGNRILGYAEYGDPNGQPIFYFHGFPGSRLDVSRFDATASSKGFRLIGIDRPGTGLSPIDRKRTILSWATEMVHFADELKIEKFSIVGYSGGAPYVAACAYAIPHRLNGAAIVSGMAPLEKIATQKGLTRRQQIFYKAFKAIPGFSYIMAPLTLLTLKNSKMMNQLINEMPAADQVLFDDPDFRKLIITSTLESFKNGMAGPVQEMKLLFNPWGFDLEDIHFPITLWHGALDTRTPLVHAYTYAKLLKNVQLKILETEGHHSLIQKHIEEILKLASEGRV